jgi:S-adenosylmethionine synthetase
MRLVFGDRATAKYKGKEIDVAGIAEESAKSWLREHLRFVDAERHMLFQNELKEGSVELTDLFEREVMGANDTSAAVGYAPLSRTEQTVLAAERRLNSKEFKENFPEVGEDVKVMGYRNGNRLTLIVGLAFVDRFIPDNDSYFDGKGRVVAALEEHLRDQPWSFDEMEIVVNALDDPQRGAGGMYLTVLGTSAEGGDSGQVGRGNRVNGVIALNRPMSAEAAAGKNPVSHVGKIYSALTHHIAGEIHKEVPVLREVYVRFCSRIGAPINEPMIASAQLVPEPGVGLEDVEKAVRSVMERALGNINDFTMRLARGELLLW